MANFVKVMQDIFASKTACKSFDLLAKVTFGGKNFAPMKLAHFHQGEQNSCQAVPYNKTFDCM